MSFKTDHLAGVLALCDAQKWPSLPSDPARAQMILTAPSASTLVALDDQDVIGFAFATVDAGPVDAYLSMLTVTAARRREGIARMLIEELFRETGAQRIDLLAEPDSEPFYDSFPNRQFCGYRLYPNQAEQQAPSP
jgi:ribosomal protein S18 acetylase RimI-like enzyme